MVEHLHASLSRASSLQLRLDAWLNSHGHQPMSSVRSCPSPRLDLPPTQPILTQVCALGIPHQAALQISDHYSEAIRSLSRTVLSEYQQTVKDLDASHDDCSPAVDALAQPCSLLTRLRDSFLALYMDKSQALLDEALQAVILRLSASRTLPSVTSLGICDYQPILEFAFVQSPKPTSHEKTILAQVTGLSPKQINIWFQNRRARSKASPVVRREPPRTIDQLKEKLEELRQPLAVIPGRTTNLDDSVDGGHDSGYESSGSAMVTVDELARRLEDFHLDDTIPPRQRRTLARVSTRTCGSSQDCSAPRSIVRTVAGKPSRTSRGRGSFPAPYRKASTRALGTAQPLSTTGSVAPSSGSAPTSASGATVFSAGHIVTSATPLEAESTSFNRARRPRKHVPLPTRRPACKVPATRAHDTSGSSSSVYGLSLLAASRSSSQSSDFSDIPSPHPPSTGSPLPVEAEGVSPTFYTKNRSGEFVPIPSSSIIVITPGTHESVSSPKADLFSASADAHVVLGPPGPPRFAPDSDPRALSANFLQRDSSPQSLHAPHSVSSSDPACESIDARGRVAPVIDNSAMPCLQDPPGTLAGVMTNDIWSRDNPAPLHVVSYAYDQAWDTCGGQVNAWAQLLGVDA